MKADGRTIPFVVSDIYSEEGEALQSAPHPKQRLLIKLPVDVEKNEILRKIDKL